MPHIATQPEAVTSTHLGTGWRHPTAGRHPRMRYHFLRLRHCRLLCPCFCWSSKACLADSPGSGPLRSAVLVWHGKRHDERLAKRSRQYDAGKNLLVSKDQMARLGLLGGHVKVLSIVTARPQFIKFGPVGWALVRAGSATQVHCTAVRFRTLWPETPLNGWKVLERDFQEPVSALSLPRRPGPLPRSFRDDAAAKRLTTTFRSRRPAGKCGQHLALLGGR